jgi:antitoxin (DNA-binding transcriptional repressor) of toxin-antitoxin stability system
MEMTSANFAKQPKAALDAVRDGEEVLITDGGVTVARLSPATGTSLMERLHRDGLLTPPAEDRAVPRLPQAEGAKDALSSLLGRLKR